MLKALILTALAVLFLGIVTEAAPVNKPAPPSTTAENPCEGFGYTVLVSSNGEVKTTYLTPSLEPRLLNYCFSYLEGELLADSPARNR